MGIIIDHSAHTLPVSRITGHISVISVLNNPNYFWKVVVLMKSALEVYWGNINTLSAISSYKEHFLEYRGWKDSQSMSNNS